MGAGLEGSLFSLGAVGWGGICQLVFYPVDGELDISKSSLLEAFHYLILSSWKEACHIRQP